MKILVKKVDEDAIVVEKDKVTLEDMQELVGGFIECLHVGGKVDMWLNDEGKLIPLPVNIALCDDEKVLDLIHGDIFFAGSNDCGDLVGLTDGEITWVQNKLSCDGLVAGWGREGFEIIPAWAFDPTVS